MVSGTTITRMFEAIIPPNSCDGIICRDNFTATCLVHADVLDQALFSSGQEGMFLKLHPSESVRPPPELLCLGEDVTLQSAFKWPKRITSWGSWLK